MDTFHLMLVWFGYAAGAVAFCWGGRMTVKLMAQKDEVIEEMLITISVMAMGAFGLMGGGVVIVLLSAILHRMIT